jgi:radical SAM superfamily enzyme YgiQ (UPF0313 family)
MPRKRPTQDPPPAREIGAVTKSWNNRLRVVLAYPSTYAVGMASLGFQTVYRLFNGMENVVCERAFLPEGGRSEIRTVESNRRPADADILAFSVSFENDYLNLLSMIEQSGIALRAEDRRNEDPLVIAGGVAPMLNPEPIAPFVDAAFIGEAEPLIEALADAVQDRSDRKGCLLRIARTVPGAYVPAFYRPRHHKDGTLASFEPTEAVPAVIRGVRAENLDAFSTSSAVVGARTAFDSRYLVEVSRGCPHGCRFCAAGYIYRPPRFRGPDRLASDIDRGAGLTDAVGLVGAAVSDLPGLEALCRRAEGGPARLSFSSLRADALTPELIAALSRSRVKTATIAPDAGSQRMRDVINKGIDEDAILSAAESLVAAGIPNLKLYFMVGLPTETDEDVAAIVSLCKRVKHRFLASSRTRGRIGDITVSLASFVPKPFTPFQWSPMNEAALLKRKLKKVKEGLRRVANLRVHADVPRWAVVQGLLSRGDRTAADMLLLAHRAGGNWPAALKQSAANPDFYVFRERAPDERLPWDFIDHGVGKAFLLAEYRRALEGRTSAPCPIDDCARCGACPPQRAH